MQYFPNSQRVIDFLIITAFEILRGVIIGDKLPISDMPPVQMSSHIAYKEGEMLEYRIIINTNVIDVSIE